MFLPWYSGLKHVFLVLVPLASTISPLAQGQGHLLLPPRWTREPLLKEGYAAPEPLFKQTLATLTHGLITSGQGFVLTTVLGPGALIFKYKFLGPFAWGGVNTSAPVPGAGNLFG